MISVIIIVVVGSIVEKEVREVCRGVFVVVLIITVVEVEVAVAVVVVENFAVKVVAVVDVVVVVVICPFECKYVKRVSM